MAKAKKSSLDMEEPVVVQGVTEEAVMENPVAEKKAEKSVVEEKKAEAQKETVEKKKRSVLICVM